jgi:SAM-dependent methyltransferase
MSSGSQSYELAPCPVCQTGAAATELGDREALRTELEALWEFHLRRLRPDVPVRYLFDRVVFSQDPPLRLARCGECGTVYRNPREDPDAVVEAYADEGLSQDMLERLYDAQRKAYHANVLRLTRVVGRTGAGLEVGSYIGAFLGAAREQGWSFDGIDVNPAAVAFARRRGVRVNLGTLEEMPDDRQFGVVAFWNCFDQLPDPRASAREARRRLRPGGVLVVRVPNGGFYTRWRARLRGPAAPIARAVLSHNNLLGFPYRHGFTPGSLSRLVSECGFTPIHLFGDTLVPVADRWTHRWAAVEEKTTKTALRTASGDAERMPWFELYARAH